MRVTLSHTPTLPHTSPQWPHTPQYTSSLTTRQPGLATVPHHSNPLIPLSFPLTLPAHLSHPLLPSSSLPPAVPSCLPPLLLLLLLLFSSSSSFVYIVACVSFYDIIISPWPAVARGAPGVSMARGGPGWAGPALCFQGGSGAGGGTHHLGSSSWGRWEGR